MTSEVAVLNCSGVALAADSAVTVGSQKIYNSAVKLFALSKVAPVAIMVYGNAALSRVPWEIVIKEYRKTLGDQTFAKLDDYATDFVKYIESSKHFFDDAGETVWLQERINSVLNYLYIEGMEQVDRELEGKGIERDRIREIFAAHFAKMKSMVDGAEAFNVPTKVLRRVSPKIKEHAENGGKHFFGDFYDEFAATIEEICLGLFKRKFFPGASSGIVIAGYGEEQVFPAIRTLSFDGAVPGFARYMVDEARTQAVDTVDMQASIIAYAQEDMVATFMEGMNPLLRTFVEQSLQDVFHALPEELGTVLGADEDVKAALRQLCHNTQAGLIQAIDRHRIDEHVNPVVNMVRALPKDELAAMAESLVNLTAFKRRVTGTLETVGGPIDVCVISKGDGLVWVKRKHYFPSELNLLFQQNYLRGVDNVREKSGS
ncbi:hypothetical protein [Stenotrophomonas maltophilia]|uniref:hypothetical protein n=1 Tax=Stenotrophomonas maltophilia TaxID=40324 RepID=UPI0039F6EFE0